MKLGEPNPNTGGAPTATAEPPEAPAQLRTLVAIVLDETGSMGEAEGQAELTRSAINEYLDDRRREVPEPLVTLVQFSDTQDGGPKLRPICEATPAEKVPRVTEQSYQPRGMTPLLDAVANAILSAEKAEVDRWLFTVYTDGQENASAEYTLPQVRRMIEERQATGRWTIAFLGAGPDAWAQGHAMGVAAANVIQTTPTGPGIRLAMHAHSHATRAYGASHDLASENVAVAAGLTPESYMLPPEEAERIEEEEARKMAGPKGPLPR